MPEPKVLIYDIETTHNILAAFDLRTEYTPHTNILTERYVVCACWKWLGEKKVSAVATYNGDDKKVIQKLLELFAEADVVVAHNGDQFDLKMVMTRALFHGLPTPPPTTTIDTYKVAKSKFRFNSNRLDYLGKFMGFGGKKHTEPGLWLEVLKGSKKAIDQMVSYNKRDVELLEKVFKKLAPYIPNHLNRELFGKTGCPRCGSKKIQSRGVHRAITKIYQRFQCQSCSGWFRLLKGDKGTTQHRVL